MKPLNQFLVVVWLSFTLAPKIVQAQWQGGCLYAAGGGVGGMAPINSTGNQMLDNATSIEVSQLKQSFGVNPFVSFGDDSSSPNMSASPNITNPYCQDGTVLIGVSMVLNQLNQNRQTFVPIVVAHEFAHIVEFKYGYRGRTKHMELVADYIAGMYFAHRNAHFGYTDFNQVFSGIFSIGDYYFDNPNHHGTPQERVGAAYAGYQLALNTPGMMPINAVLQNAVSFVEANY
jgi:hypothetical protein